MIHIWCEVCGIWAGVQDEDEAYAADWRTPRDIDGWVCADCYDAQMEMDAAEILELDAEFRRKHPGFKRRWEIE